MHSGYESLHKASSTEDERIKTSELYNFLNDINSKLDSISRITNKIYTMEIIQENMSEDLKDIKSQIKSDHDSIVQILSIKAFWKVGIAGFIFMFASGVSFYKVMHFFGY